MDFTSKNFKYVTIEFGEFAQRVGRGDRLYLRALSQERPSEKPTMLADDFPMLAGDFVLPPQLALVEKRLFSSVLRMSGPVNMWLHYDVRASISFLGGRSNESSRSWQTSIAKLAAVSACCSSRRPTSNTSHLHRGHLVQVSTFSRLWTSQNWLIHIHTRPSYHQGMCCSCPHYGYTRRLPQERTRALPLTSFSETLTVHIMRRDGMSMGTATSRPTRREDKTWRESQTASRSCQLRPGNFIS
jgi:hypothetical protein